MSGCTNRTVVVDANGTHWDLGNPHWFAVVPDAATPPKAQLISVTGVTFNTATSPSVDILFSDATAAFDAS